VPAPALPARETEGFAYQEPRALLDHKLSTGVERLDLLLGGGYTPGCATLLFGPAFCGKQQLQQAAVLRAARDGVHTTFLLHTIGAQAMSARLAAMDPTFPAAEAAGLVHYVDAHSRFLGESTGHPGTTYVDDPHDVAGLLAAVEAKGARRPPGLLAIESASTLLIDLGAAKAFTFLRTVLGRTLTQGGVGLVCLEGGMHADAEVQMAKHLCAGMVELRKKGEAHCLHVEGLETAYARPGWIEYEFTSRSFKVTGSFASRTIR
jgi:KaiC/GvpD/RAD55 family RecA-like ATPase